MRAYWSKAVILILLTVIVGLPVVLAPSRSEDSDVDQMVGERLVIYSPHNEQIRFEIESAYNDWRVAQGKSKVAIDWRSAGSTSDIRKGITSQFSSLVQRGIPLDRGIGVDLFFGGGDYEHGKIAGGISKSPNNQGPWLRIVDDPQIAEALFTQAFPQPDIGGEQLYRYYTFNEVDEQGELVEREILGWVGITLSSFGITYNQDILERELAGQVAEPTTWDDLTHPQLQGWIALANPGHSGSIRQTYNTILRRQGWHKGWQTLRRAYANTRYFASTADRVPADVSHGQAAMGLCIDFYGRYQAGAVGGGRMRYASPTVDGKSMTATTADPICLLRGSPNQATAREFIAWLLLEESQALWQRKKVSLDDGQDDVLRPKQYELRRQPIRQDLYTDEHRALWTDPELDPFTRAIAYPAGTPHYFGIVAPLTQAMAIDNHKLLRKAWVVLNQAQRQGHPNYAQMLEHFDAMPEDLTLTWPDEGLALHWQAIQYDQGHARHAEVIAILANFSAGLPQSDDAYERKRVVWREFFAANYEAVIALE